MRLIYKEVEERTLAERLEAELGNVEAVTSMEVRYEKYYSSFAVYVIFKCNEKFTFEVRDALRSRARNIVKSQQPNADSFIRFI